jgi:hypothetical protein
MLESIFQDKFGVTTRAVKGKHVVAKKIIVRVPAGMVTDQTQVANKWLFCKMKIL